MRSLEYLKTSGNVFYGNDGIVQAGPGRFSKIRILLIRRFKRGRVPPLNGRSRFFPAGRSLSTFLKSEKIPETKIMRPVEFSWIGRVCVWGDYQRF